MPAAKLEDLFLMTLKDIYHGEKQIVMALPKMAKHAESDELKDALQHHLEETKGQVQRLEQVFKMLGKPAKAKKCEAIEGLIEEGEEVISEAEAGPVADAGIIAAGQAIEHYEIARYGTLIAWAKELGMKDAAKLLGETLEQERSADQKLSKIALGDVNRSAA